MPREVNSESYDGYAEIRLVTGDKKVPLESGYKITGVEATEYKNATTKVANNAKADVKYDGATGIISVRPEKIGTVTGTQMLKVSIQGSDKQIYLSLGVKMITKAADIKKISPSSKVKSAAVNINRVTYSSDKKIIEIPISVSAHNFVSTDWDIESIGKNHEWTGLLKHQDLMNAITIEQTGRNRVALVIQGDLSKLTPAGKDTKYILNIGSEKLHNATVDWRTFQFTLTVSDKAPGFSVSLKSKIDIANPRSEINATVKFTNGVEEIAAVQLFNDSGCTIANEAYTVGSVSGNSFRIAVAQGKLVVPGVKQNLWAKITLRSGREIRSAANKPISFTPAQGKGKASQSLKAVTLYKSTPQYGSDAVRLSLTAPANVKSGVVVVNEASLKALKLTEGGFRLEQNSAKDYSIYFSSGRAPAALDKTGRLTKLKTSYTIKLDLWAEGTYTLDGAGNPAALGYYDSKGKWIAKSKPTQVKIKVNIK